MTWTLGASFLFFLQMRHSRLGSSLLDNGTRHSSPCVGGHAGGPLLSVYLKLLECWLALAVGGHGIVMGLFH